MERRLPVYLLLDISGSMSGEPIEAVRQGIRALVTDLRKDPQALETAYLSVITFASQAKQVAPLTELGLFQEPSIDASGATSLGEALRVLKESVTNEVKKSNESQKGDWKPLIFLMTDGQPTDNWQPQAEDVKKSRLGRIIACAAGPGADVTVLKQITEEVVQLNSLQPDDLKAFFKWVSSSIKTTSVSIQTSPADGEPSLPPAPQQIQIVP
jgi:uncharacterized protein YegL